MSRMEVAVSAADPARRGRERGAQLAAVLPATIESYDRLFAAAGVRSATVRDDAERALEAITHFRPGLAAQIEGIAVGAGVDVWQIAALNARTEILARSRSLPPGECSTIVRTLLHPDGTRHPVGVQTWDWHVELRNCWHTIDSTGARHRFVGLTEHGILAKIGVNSAGVALHFNILGHRDDGVGGIPVHALAAIVLEEADSVEDAVALLRDAPITSSGSLLVFDENSVAMVEVSPAGVFAAPHLATGTWLRTNHFLTPTPAAHEKDVYQSDSQERYEFLSRRIMSAPPASEGELVTALVTGPGEPLVTCVADLSQPLGYRWASLATVILDPAQRIARILDGTPAEHASGTWYSLRAG